MIRNKFGLNLETVFSYSICLDREYFFNFPGLGSEPGTFRYTSFIISLFTTDLQRLPSAWNTYKRGRIRTVDVLAVTSSYHPLFILKLYFSLHKTTYLNEEVNRTEPSPSLRVPSLYHRFVRIHLDTIWGLPA